jgi:preprotein translocase subunit SecA
VRAIDAAHMRQLVAAVDRQRAVAEGWSAEELAAVPRRLRSLAGADRPAPQLLPEALTAVREAVRRATGAPPGATVVAAAAAAAGGVVAGLRDDGDVPAALAMAAFWHALPGAGVHVVAADTDRAVRYAAFLGRVYAQLGETAGLLPAARARAVAAGAAYAAPVTVGAVEQFAIDDLRDHLYDDTEPPLRRAAGVAIVDDAGAVMVDNALLMVGLSGGTAEASGAGPAAARLAAGLRTGIDYRRSAVPDAVDFHGTAMRRVQEAFGWRRSPSTLAVDSALAVEAALLGREGLLRPDGQIIADTTVQGYLRTYPVLTGFQRAGHGRPAALRAMYGLESVNAGRRFGLRRRREVDAPPLLLAAERVVDEQRSDIYRLRAQMLAGGDAGSLLDAIAADVTASAPRGAAALLTSLDEEPVRALVAGEDPAGPAFAGRVAGAIRQAVEQRDFPGDPDLVWLIRRVRLTVLDLEWGAHLRRVRFLHRQCSALYGADEAAASALRRDIVALFAESRETIGLLTVKYLLHVETY